MLDLYRDPDFAPDSVLKAVKTENQAVVTSSESDVGLAAGFQPGGFVFNSDLKMDQTALDRAVNMVVEQEIDFENLSPEMEQKLEPLFKALDQVQQITGVDLTSPEAQNSFMAAMEDPSILSTLDRTGLYQLSLKVGNMPSLGALGPNMRQWTLSESRDGATALQSTVADNYAGRQASGARVDLGDKAGSGPQTPLFEPAHPTLLQPQMDTMRLG